jgi:hypothetical protein
MMFDRQSKCNSDRAAFRRLRYLLQNARDLISVKALPVAAASIGSWKFRLCRGLCQMPQASSLAAHRTDCIQLCPKIEL